MNINNEIKKIDNAIKEGKNDIYLEYFKDDKPSPRKIEILAKYAESKGYKVIRCTSIRYPQGIRCFK